MKNELGESYQLLKIPGVKPMYSNKIIDFETIVPANVPVTFGNEMMFTAIASSAKRTKIQNKGEVTIGDRLYTMNGQLIEVTSILNTKAERN